MLKDHHPLVSIITLNWNTTAVTCQFLESTRKLNYRNYEILVCDMNSTEDPSEEINRNQFPNTRVLRSDKNLGFSGGNNWGIRQAKGDFIFIVNNDTEVTPDLIDLLLKPFSDPSVGVVSPKIRFYHSPNVIQYAGFNEFNLYTGRASARGSREEDRGQHDQPGYTAAAHGCAMMVKREVIGKVGMFPENFFLYYEEWDWSCRIVRAGYKIYYQAEGLIYHKESMTVSKQSGLKVYYHTRNRILFMRRNTNAGQFFCFISFFMLFAVPKSALTYIFKKQYKQLRFFFKGIYDNLTLSKYSLVY